MSRSDVWAEDSDPDSDTESRKARIAHLENRYRNGQDLFIMSASIRGEMQSNPWARKRKRESHEDITGFFSVKKLLQPGKTHLAPSKAVLPDSTTALSLDSTTTINRPTPVWDHQSPSRASRLDLPARPTARIIDFKEYETQAPSDPTEATLSSKSRTGRAANEVHRKHNLSEIQQDAPVNIIPSMHERNATKHELEKIPGRQETLMLKEAVTQGPFPQVTNTPNADICDFLSPVDERIVYEQQATTAVDVQSTCVNINLSQDATISTADHTVELRPKGVHEYNGVETMAKSAAAIKTPVHDSDSSILNTQAELASAQLGLAEALRIDDIAVKTTTVQEEDSDAQSTRLEAPTGDVQQDADEKGSAQEETQEAEQILSLTIHEPFKSSSPNTQSPARATATKRSETPSGDNNRVSSAFAHLESPNGTPGSFMAFGSPLTFSLQRRPEQSDSDGGRDDTIDDIQKYLNETNFDANEEARRLMEDGYQD